MEIPPTPLPRLLPTAVKALWLIVAALVCNNSARAERQLYPPSPFVVDVRQPPYNAAGDGVTDDTDALQRAINENTGRHRALFLPAGTYLVSRTLTWPKTWANRENWGFTMIRGEDRDRTIIRLKDRTFTDSTKPQAIMWCGGFGSADWFHNYIENLTFHVGEGNPGATALQFYSNNSGAVRDCRFVAPSGSGFVGLDLGHRDMNGPLLVADAEVQGFRRGIATAHSVNSQTFERITLRGQTEVGFENSGQPITIRALISDNEVPALKTYGSLLIMESSLKGRGPAAQAPAIINYNGGSIFIRDVQTTGYRRALADLESPDSAAGFRITGVDKPGSAGPDIKEYSSRPYTRAPASPAASLRLPIKETPRVQWEDPRNWANVDSFGADPTGQKDSAAALQKAIDSGATTVFLPGSYNLRSTVVIRGKVRRIVGLGGMINYGKGLKPDLRLADGDEPVVFLEHLAHVHGGMEIDTRRTVVLRSLSDCDFTFGPKAIGGELFAEDFVTHNLRLKGQRFWGRQVNVENEGTHILNDGAQLWILGYKTERGGTLVETRGGGSTEILGGFSYTTTAGKLAPMFVSTDSSVFTFFSEVCYNGDPFVTLIRETRKGSTREIRRGEGSTAPYAGHVR